MENPVASDVEKTVDHAPNNNSSKTKEIIIIVNTREKFWGEKEISYEQLVVLAFGTFSSDEKVVYTVSYSKGENPKHSGSLVKGATVKVKEGMQFNVIQTNRS